MRQSFNLLIIFGASTLRLATPLLLAALGGLYSERSGVINIALEGLLLAGAFTAAAVTHSVGSPWIGLLAGIAAGMLVAAIHAVACIRYKADQVVSGTAINILMIGVPALLSGALFDSTGSTPQIPKENLIQTAPIVIAFALVPLTWYVLYRTPFGLRLRAVARTRRPPTGRHQRGVISPRRAVSGRWGKRRRLSIHGQSRYSRATWLRTGFIALAA